MDIKIRNVKKEDLRQVAEIVVMDGKQHIKAL